MTSKSGKPGTPSALFAALVEGIQTHKGIDDHRPLSNNTAQQEGVRVMANCTYTFTTDDGKVKIRTIDVSGDVVKAYEVGSVPKKELEFSKSELEADPTLRWVMGESLSTAVVKDGRFYIVSDKGQVIESNGGRGFADLEAGRKWWANQSKFTGRIGTGLREASQYGQALMAGSDLPKGSRVARVVEAAHIDIKDLQAKGKLGDLIELLRQNNVGYEIGLPGKITVDSDDAHFVTDAMADIEAGHKPPKTEAGKTRVTAYAIDDDERCVPPLEEFLKAMGVEHEFNLETPDEASVTVTVDNDADLARVTQALGEFGWEPDEAMGESKLASYRVSEGIELNPNAEYDREAKAVYKALQDFQTDREIDVSVYGYTGRRTVNVNALNDEGDEDHSPQGYDIAEEIKRHLEGKGIRSDIDGNTNTVVILDAGIEESVDLQKDGIPPEVLDDEDFKFWIDWLDGKYGKLGKITVVDMDNGACEASIGTGAEGQTLGYFSYDSGPLDMNGEPWQGMGESISARAARIESDDNEPGDAFNVADPDLGGLPAIRGTFAGQDNERGDFAYLCYCQDDGSFTLGTVLDGDDITSCYPDFEAALAGVERRKVDFDLVSVEALRTFVEGGGMAGALPPDGSVDDDIAAAMAGMGGDVADLGEAEGSYEVAYVDNNGKMKRKSFKTDAAREKWITDQGDNIEVDSYRDPD